MAATARFTITNIHGSQELRLNYKGDKLNGLFGIYHFDRDDDQDGWGVTPVDLPADALTDALVYYFGVPQDDATAVSAYAQAMPVVPVNNRRLSPNNVETKAAFFDGSWQFAPKWTLSAGPPPMTARPTISM
ncbi:MAG: hypothetical protein WDN06_13095 [Asticcacaulis sp.]